jgi:hypothetical protein
MYFRLGSLSFWPQKTGAVQIIPSSSTKELFNCAIVIDSTEIQIQRPWSGLPQSDCPNEYKSAYSLRSLVVCNPHGSLIFVSDLFCSSVSDEEICVRSGFFEHLESLIERGYLHKGDSVMAASRFGMESKLVEMGLKLCSPPQESHIHSTTGSNWTWKSPIEKAVNKIKGFKLFNSKIPVELLHSINEYWVCASRLANFQDTVVR